LGLYLHFNKSDPKQIIKQLQRNITELAKNIFIDREQRNNLANLLQLVIPTNDEVQALITDLRNPITQANAFFKTAVRNKISRFLEKVLDPSTLAYACQQISKEDAEVMQILDWNGNLKPEVMEVVDKLGIHLCEAQVYKKPAKLHLEGSKERSQFLEDLKNQGKENWIGFIDYQQSQIRIPDDGTAGLLLQITSEKNKLLTNCHCEEETVYKPNMPQGSNTLKN